MGRSLKPVSDRMQRPSAQSVLVMLASALLASCATQLPQRPPLAEQNATLAPLIARQDRLYRVAAPLLVRNAPLCRSIARPLLGFTAKNQFSFNSTLEDAARDMMGLDQRLKVRQVLPGSGAARAGVKPGDILLTVQDQPVPQGPNAESETARLLSPLVKTLDKLDIGFERAGKPQKLEVPLTLACAFNISLGNADFVNAHNDGQRILVTRGMLNFLQTDAELAALLAQEMAHSTLRHTQSLQMTGTVAAVIDKLLALQPDLTGMAGSAGIKQMPPEMEIEADKLALYMLVRAGYDPAVAATVWKKMAQAGAQANSYAVLHPWTTQRQSAMQATMDEIKQKQTAKKALVP